LRKPKKTTADSSAETDVDDEHRSSIGENTSYAGDNVTTEAPKSKLIPFLSEHPLQECMGYVT
jgi:hypothetical protein